MTTYILPTVLYIKQHSVTGLKYFGKTTQDPLKYNGSGKHWVPHIKKHGPEYVVNLWVSDPYTDSIAISEYALTFSRDNNIVESKEWANQKPENGLDGGVAGSPSPLKGRPSGQKGIPKGPSKNRGKPNGRKGKPSGRKGIPTGPNGRKGIPSPLKDRTSPKKGKPSGRKGIPNGKQREVECPHCGEVGGINIMTRRHFDNCKIIMNRPAQ